jgi:dTDP-4-dehydrorhamnose 3,5-epimerase
MESLDLDGAWVFTPHIHADRRGSFHEWFSSARLEALAGRSLEVAQANCSVSRRGVIRGIHFCDVPPGQAKYVTCTSGSVLDVIIDIRLGSPGFGRWIAVELTAANGTAVFIEEGLGHAFAALTEDATVFYLCSTPYDSSREHGINPLDPDIGIDWPFDGTPILSDKDAAAPSLRAAIADQLLPDYALSKAVAAGAAREADRSAGQARRSATRQSPIGSTGTPASRS